MVGTCAEDEDAERRVVAVPELRGGLLQHALKKITEVTGVYSCKLEHLEDGAQVVIRGPHGQLSHCAKLVLRAAAGDFHALSTAELFQQVSAPKKLTDSKDASGQTPLQVIGISTGCDLTLHGSKLQIQGPSAAIAKGAMKKVERFLASDTTDVNEVLQAAKAGPRNSNSSGSDIQTRAAALRRPQSRRPSKKDAEEREERFVEIPNLSRNRLLNCQGAMIRKLQELYGVHVKVLDNKDYRDVPKDSLPLRLKGFPANVADCEGVLWQMSQDDFSAIGFVVTPLRLARVDLQAFAGHKKDTRFLHNLCRNWKEVLAIDVAYDDSSKGHEKVLEITLCGELDKVMALKEAVCAFAPLIERSESYQSSELAKNTKLLKEILQEIVERGLAQPEEDTMIPHSGDQSEVSKLQKYMRRRGDELLRSLGPAAVLKLLGLTGRRLTGMVKDHVARVGGEQDYAEDLEIDCDEVKLAINDGTVFIPRSQSSGLRLGESITFRLVVVGDRCTAADLEHAAWHPPPAQPGLMRGLGSPAGPAGPGHVPDRVPVIEMRMDGRGRPYYWNHTEMTSDWTPPPPHIGFWQRLMDYRSGRPYYHNPGTKETVWQLPLSQMPRGDADPPSSAADLAAPPGVFTQPTSLRLQPVWPAAEPARSMPEEMPPQRQEPEPREPRELQSSSVPPEPKPMPRIPPTRRPDGEGSTRAREEPGEQMNRHFIPSERQPKDDAQRNGGELDDPISPTALDCDEQTELDAIVQEALERQRQEQLAEDAASDVRLDEERPELFEAADKPPDVDFFDPYGEGEQDCEHEDFEREDPVPKSDGWSKDQEEELSEALEERCKAQSASSKRQMTRKSRQDQDSFDARPPLPRRKRTADMAEFGAEEGKPGKRRVIRKPQPPAPPPKPPPPHVPPPLAAKKQKRQPEPPKEPPTWWREEAKSQSASTFSEQDEVPFKPPEPPGPPGHPQGPPPASPAESPSKRRVVTVNVVKLPSEEGKDDEVEEHHEEPDRWQDASDIPVHEENEQKRSLPSRSTNQRHSRHGTQGPGERGRKRLAKSWDSRKKEFVYHEKYEDEEPSKGGNKKAWNEGWTQDSEWADSWTGREVRSRWPKSKDSYYKY